MITTVGYASYVTDFQKRKLIWDPMKEGIISYISVNACN